ncbi:hypothetical protein C7G42_01840 [Bradyrhizobium sp. MOS003]|nr:hypothetical protein C7G42_01840 [Bradyrhizobium sp. MOS003]
MRAQRSNPEFLRRKTLDCFAALAMTGGWSTVARKQPFCPASQTSARRRRGALAGGGSTVHGVVFGILVRERVCPRQKNAKRSNPAGLVAGLLRR